jgi:hypothetical protein
MTAPASSRRGRIEPTDRSIDPTLVLAVVLPLLTVLLLAGVRTGAPAEPEAPPELTPLTRLSLGCPSAPTEDARTVVVGTSVADADGEVSLDRLGADQSPRPLRLRPPRLGEASIEGAAVVTGEDALAPGLLASRFGEGAATPCAAPAPETWFTGVGARPQHSSAIEMVNPDPGPAIADLTVLSPSGPLDVPALRGIRVPGRTSTTIDLGAVVPRRTELAVRVVVSRGRLVSSVWDTVDALGTGPSASDWLTPQSDPATTGMLLGLPAGQGSRRLTLANGGDDETRVTIRVVSPESVFAPEGLDEVRVPPGTVRSVELDAVLAPEIGAGATGLLVEATHPVTAGVRSFVDGDLAHTVAVPPVETEAAALLPAGTKRLLLAGATRPGVAEVVARTADGSELRAERVEVGPDRGISVDLPQRAAYVGIRLSRTEAVASVLVTAADGDVVVPMRETVRNGLVPEVRPGLPS